MTSAVDRLRRWYPLAIRARPDRPRWLRFGVAAAAPALAAALDAFVPALGRTPMAGFGLAVLVATWFGGLAPSLVATALSVLLVQFVHAGGGPLDLRAEQLAFAIMGVLLGVVWDSTARAGRETLQQADQLEEQALELELANQELTESIDEAQRSREAAEAAEQRYRLLFEQNPLPMWVFDRESLAFLAVNDAAVIHYGYSRAEFLRMRLPDIRPNEDVPALMQSVRASGPKLREPAVFRHRRRDGSIIMAEIRAHDIVFDGRAARLVLVTDVTDRLRAQHDLRVTTERLHALVEASPLPIVAFDLDKTVRSWNRAAERTFGWSEAEVLGQHFPAIPDERAAEVGQLRDRLERGESVYGFQTVRRRRDGSRIDVSISTAPLRGAHGESVGFVAVYEDITERRRTDRALQNSEAQLRQAQKMEAIGRLAGGMAHDFNNVLTVIQSNAELLALALPPDGPHRRDVDDIQSAARRAAALTHQLLAFSRQQVLQAQVLDVNAIVAETERMLRRVIGEDIELVTRTVAVHPQVRADPGQLSQALLNLAVNARDAMPDGGYLFLETADVELDDAFVAAHQGAQPGPHVLLSVSDSGIGMDAATQAHIFEPFFTTKEAGKGTGLGLAMVYGFVTQSGGSIWVYSEPGQGATFKIYLPRVLSDQAAPAPRVPPSAPPAIAPGLGATVLLVEDEVAVRRVARRTLTEHDYVVLEASDGEEALAVSAAHGGPIVLVITDMVMPGMRGAELAARLRQERPEIRLLIMSGYSEEAATHRSFVEPGSAFLEKPFTATRLLQKVQEVLGRP
jgi:PAS domain S-box-containing protein